MSIIWSLIAGLIVGVLAKLVIPGKQPIPIWMTILLGLVGAVGGNYLAVGLGVGDTSGIDWIRHILQVGIAAVLIALVTPAWARNRR